jgi:hypothetical protein
MNVLSPQKHLQNILERGSTNFDYSRHDMENPVGHILSLPYLAGFVLSPSKTGTTTMRTSLQCALKGPVWHAHTISCMQAWMPVLKNTGITIETLMQHRLSPEISEGQKPMVWGITYRDPVSRLMSELAHLARRDGSNFDLKTTLNNRRSGRNGRFLPHSILDNGSAVFGVNWRNVPYNKHTMTGGCIYSNVRVLIATLEALTDVTNVEIQAHAIGITDFHVISQNSGTASEHNAKLYADIISAVAMSPDEVDIAFEREESLMNHFYSPERIEILRNQVKTKFCSEFGKTKEGRTLVEDNTGH